jgi:hypothetical protein
MKSFNQTNLIKRSILITVGVLSLGWDAHAGGAVFHGKWRGECKTRDASGAEITKASRLKIVQYGSIELKINRTRYKTDQENSFHSKLLGLGRLKVETSCQFLTSEQVSGLPGPFPRESLGGFACSTEARAGVRGMNEDITTSSVMILVMDKEGVLTHLEGTGEQQDAVKLCHYQRE